jgi:hypothetical protein
MWQGIRFEIRFVCSHRSPRLDNNCTKLPINSDGYIDDGRVFVGHSGGIFASRLILADSDGGSSEAEFVRLTNWKAILIPAGDWTNLEQYQHSMMTGVVRAFPSHIVSAFRLNRYIQTGKSPVNLAQAARQSRALDVHSHWKTIE